MENIRFHITVKGIVDFKQKVLLMKRVRPSRRFRIWGNTE